MRRTWWSGDAALAGAVDSASPRLRATPAPDPRPRVLHAPLHRWRPARPWSARPPVIVDSLSAGPDGEQEPHGVERLVDGEFHGAQGGRIVLCNATRVGERLGFQSVGWVQPVHEPGLQRLRGRHDAALKQDLLRLARSEIPGGDIESREVDRHEQGIVGSEDDVHRRRDEPPAPKAVSVDHRHGWLGEIAPAKVCVHIEPPVALAHLIRTAGLQVLLFRFAFWRSAIMSSREAAAGPRQHDDPHVRILAGLTERLVHLLKKLHGLGVVAVGTVQDQAGDLSRLIDDRLVRHRGDLLRRHGARIPVLRGSCRQDTRRRGPGVAGGGVRHSHNARVTRMAQTGTGSPRVGTVALRYDADAILATVPSHPPHRRSADGKFRHRLPPHQRRTGAGLGPPSGCGPVALDLYTPLAGGLANARYANIGGAPARSSASPPTTPMDSILRSRLTRRRAVARSSDADQSLVGPRGFEPRTDGLKVRCS